MSSIRRAGRGVWSIKEIKAGTVFGPYEGSKEGKQVKGKKSIKQVKEAGYAWEVRLWCQEIFFSKRPIFMPFFTRWTQ